jgi:hypothetical protein
MIGIGVFGILPLLYGAGYYFSDAWAYISSGDKEKLFVWQVILMINLFHYKKSMKFIGKSISIT